MDGELTHETHRVYYAQFVNDSVRNIVECSIGKKHILASQDPHFNDIALRHWDNLQPYIMSACGRGLADANGSGGVSLSDCVCVAKEAARQIKEGK
jgi:hypothetical protein